ncbi:MAG: ATP-dependent DNA ligase [Burkholderiales bacterium RIFCSPHIGHO2_12_FULL_67_38]|nr:MAG: ATP-dependent DNA ligase [Burkholderiales bacterium RIFCSPLOWO2_02_FULL_67_64]OGB44473.1 MAG: ATP-dependent DNA ligase [Burkholderiales bacterium RIFCSPHIGHO2_12_FULL_67_38]
MARHTTHPSSGAPPTRAADRPDALQPYRNKRNFAVTPEPAGQRADAAAAASAGAFVVQKHWASHLHYDFRLEIGGVMKSWAVPKGPSLDPAVKHMAVEVEDHPLSYASFEGTIPSGQYGAGRVIVWDRGQWLPVGNAREGLKRGHLKFELRGRKLRGHWALVRMKSADAKKPAWLLIKERDAFARPEREYSVVDAEPDSVLAPAAPDRRPGRPKARGAAAGTRAPGSWPSEAVASGLPERFSPQLATRADRPPPDDAEWLYEIKFDGYRMLARIDGEQVRLITRNGLDWTARLEPLRQALVGLHLPSGWYDGEIAVAGAGGRPDFGALQRCFDNGRTAEVVFHVFDLPYLAGHDLRDVPLVGRRDILARLLAGSTSPAVRLSDALEGAGADVLRAACRLGLEGVIAKRRNAPYRSVRSTDWLKLKCGQRQEFVIGGYTEGHGSRTPLGALMLGVYGDRGELRHVGNVGTGFSPSGVTGLLHRLRPLARADSPFAQASKAAGPVHWVEPQLVAEVDFSGWTRDGRVRHGVFLGLREDKTARAVERELPQPVDPPAPVPERPVPPVPPQDPTSSRPVRLTHPERVIDARTGATKLDLFRHYEAVGAVMLEHLRQRPVALLRAPEGVKGETFFQKHLASPLPGVTELDPALSPGHAPWMAVGTRKGLLSAAQWNVVEFHTQNAVARHFETPNRLVFDLDPGEGVAWEQVQEAALLTKALLAELGLPCFLKTSGGKGLHVIVPVRQQHPWDHAKGFAQAVVRHMSRTIPQRFVAKSGPQNRVGKIFVDYLRNDRGATTVSAWSLRARPGMGASVPVAWDELDALRGGDHWNIRNVAERLSVGNAPWSGYARAARSLGAAMKRLGYGP